VFPVALQNPGVHGAMSWTQPRAPWNGTSDDVEVTGALRAELRATGAGLPVRTVAAVVRVAASRPVDALAVEATTSCIDVTTPTLRSAPTATRVSRANRMAFPPRRSRRPSERAEPTVRRFCCATGDHRQPPDARRTVRSG
jgi:hypothetical protein